MRGMRLNADKLMAFYEGQGFIIRGKNVQANIAGRVGEDLCFTTFQERNLYFLFFFKYAMHFDFPNINLKSNLTQYYRLL